jgi:membrane fusion protein, multidrug efflux system
VEDLDNQIALLHSRAAALDRDKAALTLAQIDFNRAKQLLGTPRWKPSAVRSGAKNVVDCRGTSQRGPGRSLPSPCHSGLPAQPGSGEDLGQVPPDLDQTFSSVLAAQADLIQSAAQFGVIHSYAQSPKQMLDDFAKQGDIDRYFAQLTTEAPAVKQAAAKLEAANRDLA